MHKLRILAILALLAFSACVPQPTPPPAPLTIALNTPTDGSVVPSLTPTLAWSASGTASYYHLQVASDSNFQNMVIDSSNIADLSYTATSGKLSHNQTYYWRVSGTKDGQTSSWSSSWSFKTEGTPLVSISVSATLDDVPWTGNVDFNITGPNTDYGSSVPSNFSGLSPGTYTITYNSGGPQGATVANISPSPTQSSAGAGNINFVIDFHKELTGSIAVNAVLDGAPWSGRVSYSIYGGLQDFNSSVPGNFDGVPAGTYSLSYHGGGPADAVLVNITPSPTLNLAPGGTIYFTMYFHEQPQFGIIEVNAVTGGQRIRGQVSFELSGPVTLSGSAPARYNNMPPGTYSLTVTGGAPIGVMFQGVMPSEVQTLGPGGALNFTITYGGAI